MTIYVPHKFGGAEADFEPRRYWEVFIAEGVGDTNQIGLASVEMCETPGGPDVSATGTPYAIGGLAHVGNEVQYAFDGLVGTWWLQDNTATARVGIDFGANPLNWLNIQDARITPFDASWPPSEEIGFDDSSGARIFHLRYSDDGVNWTVQATKDIGYSQVIGDPRSVLEEDPTDGTYRLWRLFITDSNGGVTLGANEFAIKFNGVQLIPFSVQNTSAGKAIYSRDNASSFQAYRTWDNDLNTIWVTGIAAGSTFNQYIGFCFPEPVAADEMTMTCNLPSMNRTPRNVIVQSSHTGLDGSWVDHASTNWGTWTAGETKSITW
jgi:hypothetical protein